MTDDATKGTLRREAPIPLDLESFARVQAQLHAPFASREDVLHAAGVDEAAFRTAKAHWSVELAAGDAEPMRDRYRSAFMSERAPSPRPASAPDGQVAGVDEPQGKADDDLGSPPPEAPAAAPRDERRFVASYMLASAPVASPPPTSTGALASPFAAPPPAPLAPPDPAAIPPARVQRARHSATPGFVASTEPLDFERLRAIVLADPTPFLGRTSPERLQELRAQTSASDAPPLESPAAAAGRTLPEPDETAMYVPGTPITAGGAALPFAKKSEPPAPPELDVERYAALAAEIQAKGATPAVLARYGVGSPGALQTLHTTFERRFTAEPSLRARFDARRAHFLGFMQPTGR